MSRRPPRPQSSWTRKVVQEESWDTRFHLGRIPTYDPLRDKHCSAYASQVSRSKSSSRRSVSVARAAPARPSASPGRSRRSVERPGSRESSVSARAPRSMPRAQSAGRSARPIPPAERVRERIVLERAAKASQLLAQLKQHLEKTWAALGIPAFHRELYASKFFAGPVHPNVLLQEADALAHKRAPVQVCVASVARREELLVQLRDLEPQYADGSLARGAAAEALVALCLDLRKASLAVVEAILAWRAQVAVPDGELPQWPGGPGVAGDNVLLAMKHDLQWLAESALAELLPFSSKGDPFLIYPSAPRANRRKELGNERVWSSADALPKAGTPRPKPKTADALILPLRKEEAVRVHAAEMAILDEAVAARLREQHSLAGGDAAEEAQAKPARPEAPRPAAQPERPAPVPISDLGEDEDLPVIEDVEAAERAEVEAAKAEEAAAKAAEEARVAAEKAAHEKEAAEKAAKAKSTKVKGLAGTVGEASAGAAEGARTLELTPVRVSRAQMEAEMQLYLPRVSNEQKATNGKLADLWEAQDERQDVQWFWLLAPGDFTGPGAGSWALGLFVYRYEPGDPKGFAYSLHLSSVQEGGPELEALVAAARHHVLQTLPVRGLRAALWHQDVPLEDGSGEVKFQCAKAASDAYKAARFRWFQLKNERDGSRAEVMSTARYPDDVALPPVRAGLVLRVATLAVLGEPLPAPGSQHDGPFGDGAQQWKLDNSALCAEALRHVEADLQHQLPASPRKPAAKLIESIYSQFHLRNSTVPCSRSCAGSWERVAEFAADKTEGLPSIEELRPVVSAGTASETVAMSCMHIVTHWPRAAKQTGCALLDDGHIVVPVEVHATVPGYEHPIFYLPTVQDDLFLVVLCGELLDAGRVMELLKVAWREALEKASSGADTSAKVAARLPVSHAKGVQVESTLSGSVATRDGLGVDIGRVVHGFEVQVDEGLPMPGELLPGGTGAEAAMPTHTVTAPYTIAVWHTDLGDAGVPLVVAHVSASS